MSQFTATDLKRMVSQKDLSLLSKIGFAASPGKMLVAYKLWSVNFDPSTTTARTKACLSRDYRPMNLPSAFGSDNRLCSK